MKVVNSIPNRMLELWPWVMALDAWDYCDPNPLSELVKKWPIPDEFKGAVSDIIAGRRKQKRKAAAKLKIAASERMDVARKAMVSVSISNFFGQKQFTAAVSDRDAIEPKDIVGRNRKTKELEMNYFANSCGVTVETIKDLLRDLREKINKWPSV